MRMEHDERLSAMEAVFSPRSIAFIGASNNIGKWGGIIFHNLAEGGYEGRVYPVNPREEEVAGHKAYKSILDVPDRVDLAIFTIPGAAVPGAVAECVKKRVRAGVVITAGFAELGRDGRALQEDMVRTARAGGMVLVGPNGQGIAVPRSKLYPWMPVVRPKHGSIGIATQSGNVATVLCENLSEFGFGVSKAVSAGNCADLTWTDYLDYFRQDPDTGVVLLYVEGADNGRHFFDAAKKTALQKPVVVMKAGRSQDGARAVSSHTGVLAGSDQVFSAACRQAGVMRAKTLEEAAITAATFVNTPLPAGPRAGVITGGGGFGVIAADACSRAGLVLPPLSSRTIEKLKQHLPAWWAPNNPVDMVAGIGFGGPRELIPILMENNEMDGVIMLGVGWIYSMLDQVGSNTDFMNPKDERMKSRLENDIKHCRIMADYALKFEKPLLMTSTVARLAMRRGYPGLMHILERGIMLYPAIEDAVRSFSALAFRSAFLRDHNGARGS